MAGVMLHELLLWVGSMNADQITSSDFSIINKLSSSSRLS